MPLRLYFFPSYRQYTLLLALFLLCCTGKVQSQTSARVSVYGIPGFHFTTPDDSFLIVSTPYNSAGTLGATRMISKASNDTVWEYDSFLFGTVFISDENEIVVVNRAFYPFPTFDNIGMLRLRHGKAIAYPIRDLVDSVPIDRIDDLVWLDSIIVSSHQLLCSSRFNTHNRVLIEGRFSRAEVLVDSFPKDTPRDKFPRLRNGKSLMDDFNEYSNRFRIIPEENTQVYEEDGSLHLPELRELLMYAPILVSTKGTESQLLRNAFANDFESPNIVAFFDALEAYLRDEAVFLENQPPRGIDKWCFGCWIAFELK